MSNIKLKSPITIGGQEIIVVNDVAGSISLISDSNVQYVQTSRGDGKKSPSVFCSENDIKEMRGLYPTIPVFGLWQVVFFNQLIDWDSRAYVVNGSDNKKSGELIVRRESLNNINEEVSTGRYSHGFSSLLQEEEFGEISFVDLDLKSLVLPEALKTRKETEIERDLANKNNKVAGLVSLFVVVSLFSVASFFSVQSHMSAKEREGVLLLKIDDLNLKVSSLRRTRISETPSYKEALSKIMSIYLIDNQVSSLSEEGTRGAPTDGFIKNSMLLVTSPNYPFDPSIKYPWIESTRGLDGEWIMRVKTNE